MRRSMLSCLLLAALACGGGSEPRPLEIAIEASRTTATANQAVGFVVNVQGRQLLGVTIDYDDGAIEQSVLHSSTTARVVFEHSFTVAGTYQVRATVVDAIVGSKDASIEVRIQ
jgi:hypothetical protein